MRSLVSCSASRKATTRRSAVRMMQRAKSMAADAWELLHTSNAHPLAWPEFESSGVLFQRAPFDHDKVVEHGPPYAGVWLERNDDLLIDGSVIQEDP